MNAYNSYKIGNNFHNDNGEVYFIIALDEKNDKAILGKADADGKPFYIGAQGLGMTSWNYGHYFMQNIFAAIDWYKGDSEQEESDNRPTIESILERIVDYRHMDIYIYDSCRCLTFRFKGNQIPRGFLRCHVDMIELNERIIFSIDSSSEDGLDMEGMIDIYFKDVLNFQ